jgi:parallel beta-helix repeat protein
MVENLVEEDPGVNLRGIMGAGSQRLFVRDCFFEFLPLYHRAAVNVSDAVIVLDNIEVNGGAVGSMVAGDTNGTDATIINSRFIHTIHSAALIYATDNSLIADNEFLRSPINAEELLPGGITGVTIEDNLISDWGTGIHLRGGSDCTIRNNLIRGHVSHGILLDADMYCPPTPTQDCFYATNNVVNGNTVIGNLIDLGHHPNATGNTWSDNICETTDGAEIPPCIPP